jgi:hypothetical protein
MDEPREALWQRNIAAYWRARAAKSRNPEARSHLNATAAHHQELAQAFRAPPKSAHFAFACAPKQQLILISAGKILTDAIYLDPYGAILRFTAAHGPGSLIPRPFGGREIQPLLEFAFAIGRQKAIPAHVALRRGAAGKYLRILPHRRGTARLDRGADQRGARDRRCIRAVRRFACGFLPSLIAEPAIPY